MAVGLFDAVFGRKRAASVHTGTTPAHAAATSGEAAQLSFLVGAKTHVFTIPPYAPFLTSLARGCIDGLGASHDPARLADVTILAPTRRSAQALARAFGEAQSGGRAAFLPNIIPLGDLDADGASGPASAMIASAALELSPAVSRMRRQCELARLLAAKTAAQGGDGDVAAHLALGEALGGLLDECAEHDANLAAAKHLYDALPKHLQDAAVFLEIVQLAWPQRLAELGADDPAARTRKALLALAHLWRAAPPPGPVIAAGSTGSAPATAALLAAVSSLPQGAVVLPGLDLALDNAAWEQLDEQHPQSGMKRLLGRLNVAREDVAVWPGVADTSDGPGQARLRVINEAMRPASATADWLARIEALGAGAVRTGLDGLSVLAAPDETSHARALALAVRHKLEREPGADTLIVTPDRGLGERIHTALQRWGISADHSAGQPLLETPAGAFLSHILTLAGAPSDAAALCAVAKHRLAALGHSRPQLRERFARLETRLLRGVSAGEDLSAYPRRLENQCSRAADPDEAKERAAPHFELIARIETAAAPLLDLAAAGEAPVADWARALAEAAERFAKTDDAPGADRVWAGSSGRAAAQLIRDLLQDTDAMPAMSLASFIHVFKAFTQAASVRPPATHGARVRIVGPLEARLLSADLVVLAGLNENVWPPVVKSDPFLSAGMRAEAGLPPRERRMGLSAHDFAQLACAPEVILSWSERVDAAPAAPSRWVWRLKTLCRGAGIELEDQTAPDMDYVALAAKLDAPANPSGAPIAPPEPRPPVEARPRQLSVTSIPKLIRDPYAIFAREILKLRKLDDLNQEPGPRERGIALHDVLAELAERDGLVSAQGFAERAEAVLVRAGFAAHVAARSRVRFKAMEHWLEHELAKRARDGWLLAEREVGGALTITAPAGPFTLTARADRIDAGPHGLAILDYKTGAPPSKNQVNAGLEPQLSLEAAIAAAGGFGEVEAAPIAELTYVQLTGGAPAGKVVTMAQGGAADALASDAVAGLTRLISAFDRPETPYQSHVLAYKQADMGDYDRLARRAEWSAVAEAEESE